MIHSLCCVTQHGYVAARRAEGAADATLRIELALLDRAFELAVQKRLISQRARPYIEKLFLFFSAWRIGEARHVEWKHVFAAEAAIRLPAELHKNKRPKALPIAGDLAVIMERRLAARDLTCPHVFHRNGRRIGDCRKLWTRACKAIGVTAASSMYAPRLTVDGVGFMSRRVRHGRSYSRS